jgi:hypothetical protein
MDHGDAGEGASGSHEQDHAMYRMQRTAGCSVQDASAPPRMETLEKEQCNAGDRLGLPVPHAPLETAAAMETDAKVMVIGTATMETPVVPVLADDHTVITIDAVDAGVGAHLEQPSTPKPTPSPSLVVSCTNNFFFAQN